MRTPRQRLDNTKTLLVQKKENYKHCLSARSILWRFKEKKKFVSMIKQLCVILVCITQSCKLATSLSTFSVFILLSKKGKSLWSLCKLQDIEHQLQENILHHYVHCGFLWNLYQAKNLLKLYTSNFCNTAHPYKLFTSR